MLETLNIRNMVVIESAEIPFKKGLNILSGETGAGKSIVIDAISLILGSRSTVDVIRKGCDEAIIEGLFDLSDLPLTAKKLEELGFESDQNELLVKRILSRNGKHRIYINGQLATLSNLQALGEGLVDICGQHEHQSLIKSATQFDLIDRYGGLTEKSQKYKLLFDRFSDQTAELKRLSDEAADREKRADFLKFQIEELKAAALVPDEDQALQSEKTLLQSSQTRVSAAEATRQILEEGSENVLAQLHAAIAKLRPLIQIDASAEIVHKHLQQSLLEAEEASLQINRLLESIQHSPKRLEEIQDRLALLAAFRRKYGSTVNEMIETLEKLENEFSTIESASDQISKLEKSLVETKKELMDAGTKLSQLRKKSAQLLSKSVTDEIRELKMTGAVFEVDFTPLEFDHWTSLGPDQIHFNIQSNKGESKNSIGKIASGGELSRIMLAIRRVIADKGGIGVYLFDEIDAGIGGQTAFEVGRKLKSVAKYNQVICITHIPQVASFADHHLSVRKKSEKERTLTEVIALNQKERKEELARMLGGPTLTKKSLDNASELLEMAL